MTLKGDKIEPYKSKDLEREYKTVKAMIELNCHKLHHPEGLCDECQELLTYAEARIRKCPHYKSKIPCKDCTIHCYHNPYKDKIRDVMRFSGPQMMIYHPILAVYHFLAKYKKDQLKKPAKQSKKTSDKQPYSL